MNLTIYDVLLWCARAQLSQVTNNGHNGHFFLTCLSYRQLHAGKSLEHKCSLQFKSVWIVVPWHLHPSVRPSVRRFISLSAARARVTFFLDYRLFIASKHMWIGIHAAQFGNNWMKKISRTAKIWLSETFLNSIISQFEKNNYVVLFIIWLVS